MKSPIITSLTALVLLSQASEAGEFDFEQVKAAVRPQSLRSKSETAALEPDLVDDKNANWLPAMTGIPGASQIQSNRNKISSFPRMTRHEFNDALQDLLEITQEFADSEKLLPKTYPKIALSLN